MGHRVTCVDPGLLGKGGAMASNKLFQAMALPPLRSGKSTPERRC